MPATQAETDPSVCYRHPDRTSWTLCARCGRTICPECQILTPEGVRCPECVREAGALMVVGKHEDLGFPCKASKGRGMENTVAVAFEAGSERIGFFGLAACSRTDGTRGMRCEKRVFVVLALFATNDMECAGGRVRVGVGEANVGRRVGEDVARHGRGPQLGTGR